jgi:hypothetical protein
MGKIETFNLRGQLEKASGTTGQRDEETMGAIRIQLGALLRHTADHLYPEVKTNPAIYDDPAVLDLLTDIQVLADEITQYYYSQIKLENDESNRKIEHERQRRFEGNLL